MTSPLLSVLSPSSTGPMPGGAAAAGNPFPSEGPSFSSVLSNQQAQRQAGNNAQASGNTQQAAKNNSNGSGNNATSGTEQAEPRQADSQHASQSTENQGAEPSVSGQTTHEGQQASADNAQGNTPQAAGGNGEPSPEDPRVAGTEEAADAASLHTLALAGATALAAGVETRQGNVTVNTQGGTTATVADATLAGQGAQAGQAGANNVQGTALRAASAQAGAAGRQAATEQNVRVARADAAEAATSGATRPVARAAANDAGIAVAAATALAGGTPQGIQPNSQATALRRAEPLTPARAAVLEGARRAVEAAQARAAAQEATGGSQGTDTAEFLDMLAYARSRSQPVAAATAAGPGGTEVSSGTVAFMPATPAMAAPAPAANSMVATPLGSPYWGGEFGRQVVNMARTLETGSQVIELRLDPPDLGPIRISLSLSDNVAQAAFVSPHAVVRQTVENALPQLQQLLADAGIALGDTSVSDQNQPGQQAGEGSGNGNGAAGNGGPGTGEPRGAALVAGAAPSRAAANPDALVDTFA